MRPHYISKVERWGIAQRQADGSYEPLRDFEAGSREEAEAELAKRGGDGLRLAHFEIALKRYHLDSIPADSPFWRES